MNWMKTGQDLAAFKNNMSFRLRREFEDKDDVLYLQVRKLEDIQYNNIGYTFYIGDSTEEESRSVDRVRWNAVGEIIKKAEEILYSLAFLELNEGTTRRESVPLLFLNSATSVVVKVLEDKGIIKKTKRGEVEDLILQSLQHYRGYNIDELFRNGEVDPIRLKEYEIDLKMCLTEKEKYWIGNWREHFYKQRWLHDAEWLKETEEEEEN